ncbi:hypothetical protein HN51_010946 [Arachis hypogaea]
MERTDVDVSRSVRENVRCIAVLLLLYASSSRRRAPPPPRMSLLLCSSPLLRVRAVTLREALMEFGKNADAAVPCQSSLVLASRRCSSLGFQCYF